MQTKELVEALERIRDATPDSTNSRTPERMASWTRAVAATALASGARGEAWRPIESAPRDGTFVLALVGGATDRWEHLNGRMFAIRHEGKTPSEFDLGWSVYPGFGGAADGWFSGWQPLPASPSQERCGDLVEASQSLRSVPQSAVPDAWRDIESAPRDGSKILLTQTTPGDWEHTYVSGRWRAEWGMWITPAGGLIPTHWQPLPAPPSHPSTASAAAISQNPENVQGET